MPILSLSACYLPPTHKRFIGEMNSLIGYSITWITGSSLKWTKKLNRFRNFEYYVTEPDGCQYILVTNKDDIITSWRQMGDPCKCQSGGLQQMQ
jgi:hypothetical protein